MGDNLAKSGHAVYQLRQNKLAHQTKLRKLYNNLNKNSIIATFQMVYPV